METVLRDGVADGDRAQAEGQMTTARAALDYPYADAPAPGEAVEVADGILWLRSPLPFSLNHINLWALRDGEGWTVVDTGLNWPAAREGWEAAFAGPLEGRPAYRKSQSHAVGESHRRAWRGCGARSRRDRELHRTRGALATS